jgi:hypothetical protein
MSDAVLGHLLCSSSWLMCPHLRGYTFAIPSARKALALNTQMVLILIQVFVQMFLLNRVLSKPFCEQPSLSSPSTLCPTLYCACCWLTFHYLRMHSFSFPRENVAPRGLGLSLYPPCLVQCLVLLRSLINRYWLSKPIGVLSLLPTHALSSTWRNYPSHILSPAYQGGAGTDVQSDQLLRW